MLDLEQQFDRAMMRGARDEAYIYIFSRMLSDGARKTRLTKKSEKN